MGLAIAIVYIVGWLATAAVGRSRANISQWGRLSAATIFGSLPWFGTQMATMFAWPVVLCVWLARGRPPSPWKSTTTRNGTIVIRRRTANQR